MKRDDEDDKDANDMVDSYFGTQEGDFRLELRSISARKETEDETEDTCTSENATADPNGLSGKSKQVKEAL